MPLGLTGMGSGALGESAVVHTVRVVTRLADRCHCIWRLSDDSLQAHVITTVEFAALSTEPAVLPGNPTGDPAAVAVWATSTSWYNTADGRLAPGDIVDRGDGRIHVGITGGRVSVPEEAVGGTLSDPSTITLVTDDVIIGGLEVTVLNGEIV